MKKVKNNNKMNFCVLIPTYNNDKTLKNTITSVLKYTPNVIVVNDGSTDKTAGILASLKNKIEVVSFQKNRGKGAALKAGFKRAEEIGYEYAVTIDSDGQHFPSDIPIFLNNLKPGKNILIIGKRDMSHKNVPESSVFGRKFSNFWVRLETGLDVKDAQSGYRLYTVAKMNQFHYFTRRFDFELETLVRWIWRGYPLRVVPIGVYYAPAGKRVTHFNKFKDNFRISLLNTALVTITIVCILPRRFFRMVIRIIKKALFAGKENR